MSSLTNVQPTSTSPPFDPSSNRILTGSVVPRKNLTPGERDRMYCLMEIYFAGTHRVQFEADLAEKEAVVLLRDARSTEIQGFSTLMRIETEVDHQEVVAFFSGDTIVDQQYRGETTLSRLWSRTVFAEADRIVAERPSTKVYWFLICSGYKTFRFLPVFFREFYPNPAAPTPPEIKRILDALGERKFGDQYHPESGIVRFRSPTPVRGGVADVTEQRLADPLIAFFTCVNSGYRLGDELACLTEISRSNLTRAGERAVGMRSGHS
ncbi:MAG: hypothetical protein LAO55_23755 [Acidobacteriia bacterium]|nr:hypothetical protein [Terriglobia bacterium]